MSLVYVIPAVNVAHVAASPPPFARPRPAPGVLDLPSRPGRGPSSCDWCGAPMVAYVAEPNRPSVRACSADLAKLEPLAFLRAIEMGVTA